MKIFKRLYTKLKAHLFKRAYVLDTKRDSEGKLTSVEVNMPKLKDPDQMHIACWNVNDAPGIASLSGQGKSNFIPTEDSFKAMINRVIETYEEEHGYSSNPDFSQWFVGSHFEFLYELYSSSVFSGKNYVLKKVKPWEGK